MDRPAAIDRLAAMVVEKESRATEVARLLHDNAGQTLTAIGFHLRSLGGNMETAADLGGYLEQAIANIRLACNKLQSNVVERSGIFTAIELLAERLRREAGLDVRLRLEAKGRLPFVVSHAVYRIVELALDNVSRHSGTDAAEVWLSVAGDRLEAAIQDRGDGFNMKRVSTHPPGTGLIMMETYARSANLQFCLASRRRHGTIVRIKTI